MFPLLFHFKYFPCLLHISTNGIKKLILRSVCLWINIISVRRTIVCVKRNGQWNSIIFVVFYFSSRFLVVSRFSKHSKLNVCVEREKWCIIPNPPKKYLFLILLQTQTVTCMALHVSPCFIGVQLEKYRQIFTFYYRFFEKLSYEEYIRTQ